MPLAAFKIQIVPDSEIDETTGTIRGCRLAEVGRLAVFAGKDGEPKELSVTPKLIDSLLALSRQKGRLDAFWTHDRMDGKKDALHDDVGVWRHFSTDTTGNLVADIQLAPTPYKERILWGAKNDPQGIMTSLVFRYVGGKDDAVATAIFSGDFVKTGAATTALLSAYDDSKTQPDTDMTKEEIQAAIAEGVKVALAAHKPDPATETAALSARETAAGVTDADRKPEDASLAASVATEVRIQRATMRKIEASKEEATTAAMAKMAEKIGGNYTGGSGAGANNGPDTPAGKFEAKLSALMTEHKCDRAKAKFKMAREHPDIYAEHIGARLSAAIPV